MLSVMSSVAGKLGIEDIASEVGVSPSLVSKVLSGRLGTTRVSARTIEAIRDRAGQMGYRKNSSAAALATGRQNVIGAFIHQIGVPGSGLVEELVEGIAEELAHHEQRLLLHFFESDQQFHAQCARLHRGVTDGLIVGGLPHPRLLNKLKQIQSGGVPIVAIHETQLDPVIVNVGSDQRRVGELATAHLIERGCRRIAHVVCGELRYEGYLSALTAAGLPPDPRLVFPASNYGYQAGVDAVRHFAAQRIDYDGLVTQSDQQAVGAMNALIGMGRRVPGEVRIVGVDNSPFCQFSMVPLSSVSQMERERGRRAARLILSMTNGKPARSAWIEPVLHARASSG